MSAASTARPVVYPPGLRRTTRDMAVLTRRNLRHTVRLPGVLALSLIMPAVFIVMFTYVFGGAVGLALPPAAAGRYVNWLVPGLLAQFALFGGAGTAAGLADDLAKGSIDRFRSLPMARVAVLAGRTFSDLFRSALTLALMTAVGFAIGFRWQTSLLGLLGGIGVALLFGYAWSWVMAVVVCWCVPPRRFRPRCTSWCSRSVSPAPCSSPPRPCRPGCNRSPRTSPSR
jgi:hypothetical protein